MMHLTRLRRYGDPLYQKRLRNVPIEDRYWWYVIKGEHPDDCWDWRGSTYGFGYGALRTSGRKKAGAHRISWEVHNGEIPEGMWVLHTCDNPPCTNPKHLYLGDRIDNVRDMHNRGRAFSFGPNEHPLAKLTESDVLAIRASFAGARGEKAALARKYGVAKPTIAAVLDRRTWAWLD